MNTLRPLAAFSYRLLFKHNCPIVAFKTDDVDKKIYAAGMWHFVHSTGIDQLERMDDAQFKESVLAHGHAMPPALIFPTWKIMHKQLEEMEGSLVEVESDDIANFPTTATSQTSSTH